MDRTTQELPPLPDLAPAAAAQGHRRRARTRLAAAGGVFGTVTAAALGLALLPGTGPAPASPAAAPPGVTAPSDAPPEVAASPSYRTPVTATPSPGQEPAKKLPPAERTRLADFQQQAAALLDELLPPSVGEVRPVDGMVSAYRIESGGRTFHLRFSVRPAGKEPLPECRNIPAKSMTCEHLTLGGGMRVQAYTMPVDAPGTLEASVVLGYGRSRVALTVSPSGVSAPVTARQLADVLRDERVRELLRYADEHPVQPESTSVHGG
ncbi:hypothetical protein [Streptomyces sp. CB03238]|uniref:hypothetical protein n=1 Tax=Streptomyces sp. CB03238 TaxID=1907777 RepID=UPI00117D9F25|nr:hypothetical protein [Streptomyces sp. CB03238]